MFDLIKKSRNDFGICFKFDFNSFSIKFTIVGLQYCAVTSKQSFNAKNNISIQE